MNTYNVPKKNPSFKSNGNLSNHKNSDLSNSNNSQILVPPRKKSYFSDFYGNNNWINFGKYKGKTFYDVANFGDFGYLRWLTKQNKININPSCLPHIEASLILENKKDPDLKWKLVTDNGTSVGVQLMWYELGEGPDKFKGPEMILHQCKMCGVFRNRDFFDHGTQICRKCGMDMVYSTEW